MIGTKEIVLTIIGSLILVAGLAFWYTYEPSPSSAVPSPEVSEIDQEETSLDDIEELAELDVEPLETEETATEDEEPTSLNNTDAMIDATNPVAIITTNLGTITLELFANDMPITVDNFVSLANDGFYDGTKFHRVIPGFMIQGGDPNTKDDDTSRYGQGGPGYTIQDEFVSGDHLRNLPGTIAMANTGQPNSGGSQFFINVADNRNLDFDREPMQSRHPVFGQVIEGMEVVTQIENVETGSRDIPVDPVIIETVVISQQ